METLAAGDGEDEPVVVWCGNRVASSQLAQAVGDNPGQGVIRGAPDQRMKKIMARRSGLLRCFDQFFHEEKVVSWNLREMVLREMHFPDDPGVGAAAVETSADPFDDGALLSTFILSVASVSERSRRTSSRSQRRCLKFRVLRLRYTHQNDRLGASFSKRSAVRGETRRFPAPRGSTAASVCVQRGTVGSSPGAAVTHLPSSSPCRASPAGQQS